MKRLQSQLDADMLKKRDETGKYIPHSELTKAITRLRISRDRLDAFKAMSEATGRDYADLAREATQRLIDEWIEREGWQPPR